MKMLLASDSYKGSLSTMQVAEQIKKRRKKKFSQEQNLCVFRLRTVERVL